MRLHEKKGLIQFDIVNIDFRPNSFYIYAAVVYFTVFISMATHYLKLSYFRIMYILLCFFFTPSVSDRTTKVVYVLYIYI